VISSHGTGPGSRRRAANRGGVIELDEASGMVLTAVTSGLLVLSNSWRAEEVITAIREQDVAAAGDLRDAFDDAAVAAHDVAGRPRAG
jgi:hypothetical protein